MANLIGDNQRSSLVGESSTPASAAHEGTLPKEVYSTVWDTRRIGVKPQAEVLEEFRKAANENNIVVIDDDNEFTQSSKTILPLVSDSNILHVGSPRELIVGPSIASTPTKSKKKLFCRDFLNSAPAVPLVLVTPPASETGSPQYPLITGINEDVGGWSFTDVVEQVPPLSSHRSPDVTATCPENLDEVECIARASNAEVNKRNGEDQGLQKSQDLRRQKEEQKKAVHRKSFQPDLSSAKSTSDISRVPESPNGVRLRETDVSMFEDKDVSLAWDLHKQASGILPHEEPSAKINPYSRDAANEYRTQDRHLENPTTAMSSTMSDIPQQTEEERRRREDRLIRMKQNSSAWVKKRKRSSQPEFVSIDLNEKRKRPRITKNATSATKNISNIDITAAADLVANQDDLRSDAFVSTLNDLRGNIRKKTDASASASTAIVPEKDFDEMFPLQLPEEHFANNTQKLTGLYGEIARQRDSLRERLRDLESIRATSEKLAELLTIQDMSEAVSSWIGEVRLFTKAVLDDNRPGKLQRKRVNDIRENAVRRMSSSQKQPSQTLTEKTYPLVLTAHHIERLAHEILLTEADLRTAQAEAKAQRAVKEAGEKRERRANRAKHKQQQQARAPRQRLSITGDPNLVSSEDQAQIVACRELLAMHDAQLHKTSENQHNVESIDLDYGNVCSDPDDDDMSEEEEGESYMRPAGNMFLSLSKSIAASIVDSPQNLPKTQPPSSFAELPKEFQAPAQTTYHGSQGFNQEMLDRMKQRSAQQATTVMQIAPAQSSYDNDDDEGDCSSESEEDCEIEDAATDDESETVDFAQDEDGNPVCNQYFVRVTTQGLRADDDYEHTLYDGFDKERAVNVLESVGEWFLPKLKMYHRNISLNNMFSSTDKRGSDQVCEFKIVQDSKEYGFRAVLASKSVRKSLAEMEKAKSQRIFNEDPRWSVDWTKILKPYKEDTEMLEDVETGDEPLPFSRRNENDTQSIANNAGDQHKPSTTQASSRSSSPADDMSSLFGDDEVPIFKSSPPSTCTSVQVTVADALFAPKQVVERIGGEQKRSFTTISLANRHAKKVFETWLHSSMPGRNNEDYLKQQDEEMESELESMGNMSLWQRQFECIVTNTDGSKHVESMHVQVLKDKCWGPTN